LIVARGTILAHTFPVAITTAPVTTNPDMKLLEVRSGLLPFFLAFRLEGVAAGLLASIVDEAVHGTKEIRKEGLRAITLGIPPLSEQHTVAAFINRESARIDALVGEVPESIDLLKKYCSALISAAVTGKIDVREEGA
jgi:type I restriction enzyme S subunit